MQGKAAAAFVLLLLAQQAERPQFRAATELVMVDVQVIDRNGDSVVSLKPEAFEVWIDSSKRPVTTLSLVTHSTSESAEAGVPSRSQSPSPITSPAIARSEPRTLILGIDQASLLVVNKAAVIEAVTRLLSMVSPDDLVGLDGFPGPGPRIAPTRDREAVLKAVRSIDGQFTPPRPHLNISIAEAIDIVANDPATIAEVRARVHASGQELRRPADYSSNRQGDCGGV